MSSVDLNGLLARFVAVELEAFATIPKAVDCYPIFYHQQSSYPYIIHRVARLDLTYEDEDFNDNLYAVEVRLIIGNIDNGYKGEQESALYGYIPLLVTYFSQRRLLQSAAYPAVLNKLMRAEMAAGANSGWTAYQDGGIAGLRVGTSFQFVCEFNETIEQAYN